MIRRIGFLAVIVGLSLPVWSSTSPGTISGYVRNGKGAPQMGALVEVLGSAAQNLKVFTDERGFYSIRDLLPGVYSIKISAPAFLPALRERLGVRPGGKLMVNVTLTTLFELIELGPLRGPADDDEWKWTLRSVSNRPILRALDDGTMVVAEQGSGRDLKGSLSLMAGSPSTGFGNASDMNTAFSVERSLTSSGRLSLQGDLGYGTGIPSAVLRTAYSTHFNNGLEPSMAFTMRRYSSPDVSNSRGQAIEALSLTTADRMTLGNVLELKFGSELQTIQFLGRLNAFQPFGSADLHLSPNTVVEYRFASSVPNATRAKGFDLPSSDLSETGPRVSVANFTPAVERARHQEVSLSRRLGKNNIQVAYYSDRIADPALTGVGELAGVSGDVLPDPDSGTFTYQGSDLETNGMRLVLQRKLMSDLTATLDYAYGGTLDLAHPDVELEDAHHEMHLQRRHAMAAKFSGTIPRCKTSWLASYLWTSGPALTPVDLFNSSPGQAEPFLSVFLRQPIPTSFLAGHMDLLVDLRNLLAQGYVPVVGHDGHTVYLVQSARSVRGGVAFNF